MMDPNSYLQTGIDNTDILNLQQDTQDRLNKLFQSPNLPSLQSQIPNVQLGQEGVVNPGDNINVKSLDSLYGQMTKNTIKGGSNEYLFDADNFVSQKDTDKYLDEKFGYTYGIDNEDWYAQNQSGWERLGKGLVGFATKTAMDFTKGAGFATGLVNPFNWDKNWIGNASDNLISKISQNVEDKVLQDWLPQFQEASDRGKGIVWRMFHDQNFWTEDVVDLGAFTASAFLTGGATAGLKIGSKLGPLMTGMQDLKTAEGFLTAAGKVANTTDRIAATALNTIGESMFEAKSVRDKVYQNQIDKGTDEDTARELSNKAAENTFFGNVALLSLSNYWETGIFFNRLKNTSKAAVNLGENTIVDNIALKAPEAFEKLLDNKWTYSLKKMGEGFAVEGLYEENGQLAISRNAEKEYSSKDPKDRNIGFFGNMGNVFTQWYKQTKDAYKGNDEEAFENIFLGGLFGSVMGVGSTWINKEYNEKRKDAETVVNNLNAAKGAWLKRADIYDVDANGKIQFNEEKFLGAMYGNMDASTKQQLADYYKDENNREVAKKDAFSSYALAHFKSGTQDKLLSELDSVNKLSPDELVRIGFNPETEDIAAKVAEYKNYTNKLKDIYDSINKHYKYNGADPNVDIYRRDYLFNLAAKQIAFREQASKAQAKVNTISSKLENSSLSDSLVDSLNYLNTRIKLQEHNVQHSQDEASQEILDKLIKRYTITQADNEESLKNIKKDKDGYFLYENTDRNSDILAKDLQDSMVQLASLDSQEANIKLAFDKYSNKKKGYDAFYNDIVKPDIESMIAAKDEIAKQEETQQKENDNEAKPAPEELETSPQPTPEPKEGERQDIPVPESPVSTSAEYRSIKSLIDSTDEMNDENAKYLLEKISKALKENKISKEQGDSLFNIISTIRVSDLLGETKQSNIDGEIWNNKGTKFSGKTFVAKDGNIYTIEESELKSGDKVIKVKDANGKTVASAYFSKNDDGTYSIKKGTRVESFIKGIGLASAIYDYVDNNIGKIKKTDTTTDDGEGLWKSNQSRNYSNENEITTTDIQGDYNPEAPEDVAPNEKQEQAYSLVSYKTSNKTVTQEEIEDDKGAYTGKLDEDEYKQFKQNFIRDRLSYEGALFNYGAKIIRDSTIIPKEARTIEALNRNPSLLGSVLVMTNKEGQTLYFDKDYNESLQEQEGFRLIAYSFTDKYWARDESFRAALGEERTEGQITAEEFLKAYANEAKQRDIVRELNKSFVEVPVTLTGFNQGAMQYGKEYRTIKDIAGFKPIALIVAGSKEAPTGEKFTSINGQKLAIGGFYANLDGKFFRIKPSKLTEVKIGQGDVTDLIVGALVEKFKNENDASFVRNFIAKVLFVNRPGRPEMKIYGDAESGYEIKPIFNGSVMKMSSFTEWLDNQYLNVHSDSLGQKIDIPEFAEGIVSHSTVDYNNFIMQHSRSNVKGITTSEGIKIMPLNGFLTFTFNQSLQQLDAKTQEGMLPWEQDLSKIKPATEELEEEGSISPNLPDWVREEIQRNVDSHRKLIPQVITLSYNELTTKQVANKLGVTKDIITSLKTYLGIPSMDSIIEFDEWKRKINESKPTTPTEKQAELIQESPKDDTTITNSETQNKPEFEDFNEEGKSKKDIQDEIDKFRDQNRLERTKTNVDGTVVQEPEINHVRQIFGNEVNLTFLQDVVDASAWGTWTSAGITLYKDAPQGTGYHEAWHQFSQIYLTQNEKKALYNEVRNKIKELKNAPDFEIEEAVAEDFRKYTQNQSVLNNRPHRNSLFRKILDFIKRFFFNKVNLDKLYQDLYRGDLKSYNPSINNALFGKLNSKITNPITGQEVLDNQKTSYYTNVIDVLLGNQLSENNTSPAAINSNPRLAAYLYQNIKATLINDHYNVELNKYKAQQPYNEELLKDLQKILKSWNAMIEYHKQHSKLGVYIEEDIPEIEEDFNPKEEQQNSDKDEHKEAEFGSDKQLFDRKGNEESSIASASEEIRGLIRILPEVEAVIKDGKTTYQSKLDHNGFPKLNDYSRTWNNLAIELAGDISYQRMYTKLTFQTTLDKVPEAAELAKRLPDPNNIANPEQRDMAIKFTQAFSKANVPINSVLKDGSKYILIEETNRNRDSIQKQWTANFMSHGENSDPFLQGLISIDEQGRNYITPEKRFNYKFQTEDEINSFLKFLGFDLSVRSKKDNKYRQNIVAYSKALQNALNQRLINKIKISDPVLDLGKDFMLSSDEIIPGVRRITNALLNIESKYSSTNPSMSYQTSEGEVIYGLSFNNTLTLHSYFLNNANTLDQLYSRPETLHLNPNTNPYVKNSIYLNALFDFETGKKRLDRYGNPIKLLINNYNGMKEITPTGTKGKSTANLNQREKMVMDLNSLLTSGIDEIMRTESSSSAWSFALSAYDSTTDKKLPISIENFERGFNSELTNIWKGYIYDELFRIQNADSVTISNYPKEAAKEFNLNYDVLTPELKTKLKDELAQSKDIQKLILKHEKEIDNNIIDFFTKESDKLKRRYTEENISKNDISTILFKYTFDQLVRAFVANDFIKNVEYTKIIAGDTIYQAHYKDYHKRAKGAISTGTITVTDNWFASHMQAREKNTFAGSMGIETKNDYKRVKTYNLRDDIRVSKYHETGILQRDLQAVNISLTKEQVDKLLKAYSDLNVADGQGHVTLDFYRQFLIARGNWPFSQEIAYQKELAWFRMNYSDQIPNYTEDQRKADQAYIDKHANVHGYFPPLKIQYDGPIEADQTYAHVMDKFSVVPLIPSVIKGKAWEKVNLDLIKRGAGYTKFESGTKMFKFTPVDIHAEVNGKKVFSPQFDQVEPATHFLTYLKEQINTSFKIKEDTRFGSQIRKLILANQFSNGIASDKYIERLERYVNILKRFQDEQKHKLFKRIGIEDTKDGFKIRNMDKFISQIQFEAKRQGLNDNILDYIQYDKDTKGVVYPLESSLNRGPIQDLVMGMIDRELRIHKMNGDMAIQVSSSGYEDQDFDYTNPNEEDIKKYGTNGLGFYHLQYDENGKPVKTNKMQVKVALVGSFTKLLNRTDVKDMAAEMNISPLQALNRLIKSDSWIKQNEKLISLIGYRIPTQGINSMENMIIQEFLPEQAGSIIIPPAEIVAKSGSDYDIDKLNIFKPSLTEEGEYIGTQEEMKKKINDRIDSLESKIEELRRGSDYFAKDKNVNKLISAMFGINEEDLSDIEQNELDDMLSESDTLQDIYNNYKALQGLEKGYLSNQIIELYDEVLSDPDMFSQLITPNSTDLIKDKTNELSVALGKRKKEDINKGKQGYLRTQIYRAVNNYRKFESLLEGKKFLGVFASNNTLSQLFQQNDIRINTSYTHPWVKQVNGKPFKMSINPLLLNLNERKQITGEDGKIKLGEKFNVDGELKQDYISQLVNAAVDIASDDFIGYINLNWENIGVMNYLIQLGVPYDRIIYFINQPIMQKYYEMLRRNSGITPREVQMMLYEELTGETIPRSQYTGKRNSQFFMRAMQYAEQDMQGKYFSKDRMLERIKKVGNKYNEFLTNPANIKEAAAQIYFFAHFVNLQDQAKQVRSFQSVSNFDTNKLASPIDAYTQLLNRSNVARIGMFDQNQIDKITNNSIISVFNNNSIVKDLFSQLMPAAYKEGFLKIASELMNETYLSSKDRKKVTKLLVNDFVEFVIKNFGDYNGKSLSEVGALLMTGDKTRPSLAKRAVEIKAKYPELADEYNIVGKLFPNFGNRKRKIDNIEITRVFENTVDDQNRYIDEFRKLINFSDRRYQVDQQSEIRKFFRDLAVIGFFQSGFNKSPISFQELIPYEQFANIFKEAIYTFEEVSKADPKLADGLYQVFKQRFKLNNSKFFGKKGTAEPYRLKPYGIRNEELINRINKIMAGSDRLKNLQLPKPADIAKSIGIEEEPVEQDIEQETDFTPDATEAEVQQPQEPVKGVELFKGFWTRDFVAKQTDKVFLFGDNTVDSRSGYVPSSTQAVIRGLPNAIGIVTKRNRGTQEDSYLKDSMFDVFKNHLDSQIKKALDSGKTIVIPADGIGTGKAQLSEKAPKIAAYLNQELDKLARGVTGKQDPADIQRQETEEKQIAEVNQSLEDSPPTSLFKTEELEEHEILTPQQEAIKKANDFIQANDYTFTEFLKENEYYYYPVSKSMSEEEFDKIIENKSNRIRITKDNYDYAIQMSSEIEDFISDKNDNAQGDLIYNYEDEKKDKSYDRYIDTFGLSEFNEGEMDALHYEIYKRYEFGVNKAGDIENSQDTDVNKILQFYQNELYSNDKEKQHLEDFFKKYKIDPNYNPNQLALFDTTSLEEMKKQVRDNIDDITKDLNQRC